MKFSLRLVLKPLIKLMTSVIKYRRRISFFNRLQRMEKQYVIITGTYISYWNGFGFPF